LRQLARQGVPDRRQALLDPAKYSRLRDALERLLVAGLRLRVSELELRDGGRRLGSRDRGEPGLEGRRLHLLRGGQALDDGGRERLGLSFLDLRLGFFDDGGLDLWRRGLSLFSRHRGRSRRWGRGSRRWDSVPRRRGLARQLVGLGGQLLGGLLFADRGLGLAHPEVAELLRRR